MSENFHVSEEFLAEEKKDREQQQLGQTMPKLGNRVKTRGGPYTIHAKKARRDEVFRLHFDYGYSARKISEMLKINRNTINSDIKHWYLYLNKQDKDVSVEDMMNKMYYRFESKRTRIMKKLEKAESIQDFALLEKMLYDIDSKVMQNMTKIQLSEKTLYDKVINRVNDILEENGYDEKYALWGTTLKLTDESSRKINKIIKTDKYQKSLRPKIYDPDSRYTK